MLTKEEIIFANKFNISTKENNEEILYARIIDYIDTKIFNRSNRKPTDSQIKFAATCGIDITNESYNVAFEIIHQILYNIDIQSIDTQKLAPGDTVTLKDYQNEKYIISSIKNGIVYFKGGNGQKASARNVFKIWENI